MNPNTQVNQNMGTVNQKTRSLVELIRCICFLCLGLFCCVSGTGWFGAGLARVMGPRKGHTKIDRNFPPSLGATGEHGKPPPVGPRRTGQHPEANY